MSSRPHIDEISDASIREALSADARRAIELLYLAYARYVAFSAMRILRDETEAADLVHDLFLYFLIYPDKLRAVRGSFKAFLGGAARKAAQHEYRKSSRRRQILERYIQVFSLDPLSKIIAFMDLDAVWQITMTCYDRLSFEHKQCIRLRYFEDYTYEQIMSEVEISMGGAYNRVRNALNLLKECLRNKLYFETHEVVPP